MPEQVQGLIHSGMTMPEAITVCTFIVVIGVVAVIWIKTIFG